MQIYDIFINIENQAFTIQISSLKVEIMHLYGTFTIQF